MTQQPSDPTSHEVDRHVDDQPPRDDLLDPNEIDPDTVVSDDDFARDELAERDDIVSPPTPAPREFQPETQGSSAVDAASDTEDAGVRHPLSDEEVPTDPSVVGTSATSAADGLLVDDVVPTDEEPVEELFTEADDPFDEMPPEDD